MDKAALADKVRQQKEELAIREQARQNEDHAVRKKYVTAIVQLCVRVMDWAVRRSKNSCVICFEQDDTPAAMNLQNWEKALSKLAAVGYKAELVDTVPDVMAKPLSGSFRSYEKEYTVAGQEYISFGRRLRAGSYRVTRKFASVDGKMVAIKISLV